MQLKLFISAIGDVSRYSFKTNVDGNRAYNDFNTELLGDQFEGTPKIYNAYLVQYLALYKNNQDIINAYKQYLSNDVNINGILLMI